LSEPILDYCADTLGVRKWQHAGPLTLDDAEHFSIAHAAEALDKIFLSNWVAAGGQDVSMSPVNDRLAVDQHSVAVENDQLDAAGDHLIRLPRALPKDIIAD
jgi:hypothetical protein